MSDTTPAATAPVSTPAPEPASAAPAVTSIPAPAEAPQAEAQQPQPLNATEAREALFGRGEVLKVDSEGRLHAPDGKFVSPNGETAPATAEAPAGPEAAAGGEPPAATKEGDAAAQAPDGHAFARIAADGPLYERLSKHGLLNERGELSTPLPQDVVELIGWSQNNFLRAADVGVAREEARMARSRVADIERRAVEAEAQRDAVVQQLFAVARNPQFAAMLDEIESARTTYGDAVADAALEQLLDQGFAPAEQFAQSRVQEYEGQRQQAFVNGLISAFDQQAQQFFPLWGPQERRDFLAAYGSELEAREVYGQQVDYSLDGMLRAAERLYVTHPTVLQQEAQRIQQWQAQEHARIREEAAAQARQEAARQMEEQARNAQQNVHGRLGTLPAASLGQIDVSARPRNSAEARKEIFGY